MKKICFYLLGNLTLLSISSTAYSQELSAQELMNLLKCDRTCFSNAIEKKGFKYSGGGYEQYHPTMIYTGEKKYQTGTCTPRPNSISLTRVGIFDVLNLETYYGTYDLDLYKEFGEKFHYMYVSDEKDPDDGSKITIYRSDKYPEIELEVFTKQDANYCVKTNYKLIKRH